MDLDLTKWPHCDQRTIPLISKNNFTPFLNAKIEKENRNRIWCAVGDTVSIFCNFYTYVWMASQCFGVFWPSSCLLGGVSQCFGASLM